MKISIVRAVRAGWLPPARELQGWAAAALGRRAAGREVSVLLPVPELLLLDEPFSNMDVESVRQMVELLAGFRQSNRTIVITTHQREAAAPIADWVLALHAGRVQSFEPGSPTL